MPIERRPSEDFAALVEKYWFLPGKGGTGESPLEFLPDGHFALGFGISGSNCRILAGGPCTKVAKISVTDARDFLFVRFRPGRLPRLLDIRPADLVDRTEVDLSSLLGKSPDELGERLRSVQDFVAKQAVLEALFRSARMGALCQDRRCLRAVERVETLQGRIRVVQLARELGLSTRTLERLFLDQVGLTPKGFIRNVRFQHALRLLRAPRAAFPLIRIAQECGYADQTHFINDFKTLAGRLPTDYRMLSCRVSPIRGSTA